MHDSDDPLREQVRKSDPARDLAPVPRTWLDHRMEQIVTESSGSKPTTSMRSRRRVWIPAATAAAALAAAIVVPLALGSIPTTETLALPGGGGTSIGSCLPVSPEGLRSQDEAFAARVVAVEGDLVTLEVTERFAGEVADRVEVEQEDAIDSDFASVQFELGEGYLIAAGDGTIRGCGLSGADTADLRALYDAAFDE